MNILIIAADVAPSGLVGARRPTLLANEMAKRGHAISVVTLKESCLIRKRFDQSLAENIEILRISCGSPWQHALMWRENKSSISRALTFPRKIFAKMTARFLPIDELSPWAYRSRRRVVDLVKRKKIEAIWVTVPAFSSITLACSVSKRCNIPYVVDFRDIPPERRSTSGSDSLHRNIEYALQGCVAFTHTSSNQEVLLRERFTSLRSKPSLLLYNFTATSASMQPSGYPITNQILYGGSLYGGGRRIDGFLKALSEYNRYQEDKLYFHAYCLEQDAEIILQEASKLRCKDYAKPHPYVSDQEFAASCSRAKILLLVIGDGVNHTSAIPAKVFDYIHARRPILVLAPGFCEAAKIVVNEKCGVFASMEDGDGIVSAIKALARGENLNGEKLNLSKGETSPYDCSGAATGLIEVLEEACLSHRHVTLDR